MGKESQKSALPTLFHFVRVRAAYQPHVHLQVNFHTKIQKQIESKIAKQNLLDFRAESSREKLSKNVAMPF